MPYIVRSSQPLGTDEPGMIVSCDLFYLRNEYTTEPHLRVSVDVAGSEGASPLLTDSTIKAVQSFSINFMPAANSISHVSIDFPVSSAYCCKDLAKDRTLSKPRKLSCPETDLIGESVRW